ncbi:hypothetical protein [Lewinella sp. 4G2]|uniref:hypothetical protein n=1 Tax=Lewinella sp. 4G2 TaxID=1803372 RepID=UPI0007B47632|nr:hypothetical protein [Lewinella sp. 4G2]OAV45344.1 hypothetical protein A3850_012955 [Lewinella sp. 4G2]
MQESTSELWNLAWQLLQRGSADKKHRFSTATISTDHSYTLPDGIRVSAPRSRTVVLRKVDRTAGVLTAYTDHRSFKVDDLRQRSPYLSWCFWDPRSSVQVTALGEVTILDGPIARQRYLSLPKHSRKAYATRSAPGRIITDTPDDLPKDWDKLSQEETNYAAENFVILECRLLTVDVLQLGRNGHQRLRAQCIPGDDNWRLEAIVP